MPGGDLRTKIFAISVLSWLFLSILVPDMDTALAAPAADCSSVIAQTNSAQQSATSSVNTWINDAGKWIQNPAQRGSAFTQTVISSGNTARTNLENFQSNLSQLAAKDCGESSFNNLYDTLKTQTNQYNNIRENIKDPGDTGGDSAVYQNTFAFSVANITYAATTANQCATLFSQLSASVPASEQQLQLLEQAATVHNNDILAEYQKSVEPAEIKASTAWQTANSSLQDAARLGCDKSNASQFQAFRDQIKGQADRINTVRDRLAKDRLSITATVDQTVRNIFSTCEDCEKAGNAFNGAAAVLIKPIFNALCCLLSEFVKTLRDGLAQIANQLGDFLKANT